MQVRSFGDVDGVEIKEITLRNAAGATASVITWGAVLRDLVVQAAHGPQRVVLGLNSIEDYRAYSPHFGRPAGAFREPDRRWPLHARRHDLPPADEREGQEHAAWWPQGVR